MPDCQSGTSFLLEQIQGNKGTGEEDLKKGKERTKEKKKKKKVGKTTNIILQVQG